MIFAGVYSFKAGSPNVGLCSELRDKLSRDPSAAPAVYENGRLFLTYLDPSGCSYPPREGGDSITIVAGEPLMSAGDEVAAVAEAFAGKSERFTHTNGVWCAAQYDGPRERLSIAGDVIGIRPVYYWHDDNMFIFATALRIIEELDAVPKTMDLRAVTEIAALGYPLGNRTPYHKVTVLGPAEVLTITRGGISSMRYPQGFDIEATPTDEEQQLDELHARFLNAVKRRQHRDKWTIAYLSGGLDSRCVVGGLTETGANVHTFNFARENTQDQVYGRMFAELAGCKHHEQPKRPGDQVPDYSTLLANAWKASNISDDSTPERPNFVWSGEGGSVLLGHVHLDEQIVELMRSGRIRGAIDRYIAREQIYISPRLFRPRIGKVVGDVVRQGILDEVERIRMDDPARRFYMYLMLNDQRRKLAEHFENQDLHRLEFHLPFLDVSFLRFVVSIPMDRCLRHEVYVKWLSRFPATVTSVPWQSYPGHRECPVAACAELSYQWGDDYQAAERRSLRPQLLGKAAGIIRNRKFPNALLSRGNLRLVAFAHRTGLRDYGYVIETADTYWQYWQRSGGRFVLDQ